MTAPLKPCPFCGGVAIRHTLPVDEFGNEGGDVIECGRCFASSHVEFDRKENLVSTWNRRADTPKLVAVLRALGDAIEMAHGLSFSKDKTVSEWAVWRLLTMEIRT